MRVIVNGRNYEITETFASGEKADQAKFEELMFVYIRRVLREGHNV